MTYTNESELKVAALSVVLQPAVRGNSIPLIDWLGEFKSPPVWIPLARRNGVTKAIAILNDRDRYPALMQSILLQITQSTAVEWQGKQYELTGVEVNSHQLHVLEIPFFGCDRMTANLAEAIRAQCVSWVEKADPILAERLYSPDNFPMTLAIKSAGVRSPMSLRIGLLQGELLAPLLWGMQSDIGGEVTFDFTWRIGNFLEIQQSGSFESLLQVPTQNIIKLEFLTPTSFKQRGVIQTFPLPDLVFSSLLRRWNAFAPEKYQFRAIAPQGFTSAYDLQTQALKIKNQVEIGAKGWVRYEFPDPEEAKIATVLAHFAAFAGVGRKTAMGMGQTRIIAN